jgi:hypothetical protein
MHPRGLKLNRLACSPRSAVPILLCHGFVSRGCGGHVPGGLVLRNPAGTRLASLMPLRTANCNYQLNNDLQPTASASNDFFLPSLRMDDRMILSDWQLFLAIACAD